MFVIINFGTKKHELHLIPPLKTSYKRIGYKNQLESFRRELGEKLALTFPHFNIKVFEGIYPMDSENKTFKSIYQFGISFPHPEKISRFEKIKEVILNIVKNGQWLNELPHEVVEKIKNNAQILSISFPSTQIQSISNLESENDF